MESSGFQFMTTISMPVYDRRENAVSALIGYMGFITFCRSIDPVVDATADNLMTHNTKEIINKSD